MNNLTLAEDLDLSKLEKMIESIEYPDKDGKEELPTRVLFICSGNTCRSPMAAAVLNHLGKGKFIASSAGISAFNGDSLSEDAVTALQNAGIPSTEGNDYKNHFSRRITEEIIKDCDKIVAISLRHLLALVTAFPEYADKMITMPRDISDPYMLGLDEYEKCLSDITDCIKELFLL